MRRSCLKVTVELMDLFYFQDSLLVKFDIWQEDWQMEKRDFLQSLSHISTLPRTNVTYTVSAGSRPGQLTPIASSPHGSSGPSSMELVPLDSKPIHERKASVYAEVVKNLNNARQRGLPFKVSLFLFSVFFLKILKHISR